jgi:hypothetical protein
VNQPKSLQTEMRGILGESVRGQSATVPQFDASALEKDAVFRRRLAIMGAASVAVTVLLALL